MNLLFLGIVFLAINTCTENNPVIEKKVWSGPSENGDLHVLVHNNITYYAGVTVQIFLSEADRTNNADGTSDFQYQAAATIQTGTQSSDIYATFYSLPYQKYYIKAIIPTGPWKGIDEVFVKKVSVSGTMPTIIDVDCN